MPGTTRISLRLQVTIALLALATLFATAMSLQVRSFEQAVSDQALLSEVQTLTARFADIERRGRGYAAVAPRDYESYARDVAVIYSGWQEDLLALDSSMTAVSAGAQRFANHEIDAPLMALTQQYADFRAGLKEKIGDELARPRLEWGAQFIEAQAPGLTAAALALKDSTGSIIAGHLHSARRVSLSTWIGGGLILLGIGLWFWLRVVGRLGRVASACNAVAEGAFGTRAPVDANDELGDLSRAFNQLSSRTRVVLGVLDRLPDGASAQQAFELLWEESREHLGHRWQGLFEVADAGRDSHLLLQREADGVGFSTAGSSFALTAIGHQAGLGQQDSALWSDVRRHTLDQTEGRLLRELSRRELRTLALVRLRDPATGAERLLAFAWADVAAEETGVARFLGGLARFLGRALSQREVPSLIAQLAARA
jgi:HAMP domain-containing protein